MRRLLAPARGQEAAPHVLALGRGRGSCAVELSKMGENGLRGLHGQKPPKPANGEVGQFDVKYDMSAEA